jgi:hypothetical protein
VVGAPPSALDNVGYRNDVRRWERPYSLDSFAGSAVLGLPLVAGLLGVVVYDTLRRGGPLWFTVVLITCGGLGLLIVSRIAMLGVFVATSGIRSRSMLRTVTVPWDSVSDIHSGIATIGGLDMGRSAIVIVLTDGSEVQTPIQRGDFMRPFTFRPELGRIATWPAHYDQILEILRTRLREARQERGQPAAGSTPGSTRASNRRPIRLSASSPADPAQDKWETTKRDDPRLHVLARLYERGVITETEFESQRAALLAEE